ncbi:PHO85 cyclin-5 [Basidiobolus ranarum]|uniref:PHO85 cyclin-5 n=1 Tax=Basidiobolus ranarum TaxID=34480 RepID=A0ABR2WWX9_9FUNG
MHYTNTGNDINGGLESLVDAVEYVIDRVWSPFGSVSRTKRLIFRGFVRETVKTSRVFYSTVMISLYYLYKLRGIIGSNLLNQEYCLEEMGLTTPLFEDGGLGLEFDGHSTVNHDDRLCFAKNTFIGALIAASKYHQENSPLNMDWARYTNSELSKVNDLELEFLGCIKYNLHVSTEIYESWNLELLSEVRNALLVAHHKKRALERNNWNSTSSKSKMTDHYISAVRMQMDSWKSTQYDSIYKQTFPARVEPWRGVCTL